MNIGGVLSLHHQAEILTTTDCSRASAVVAGEWRAGLALPQFSDREQRILKPPPFGRRQIDQHTRLARSS
jgi:hypothetical protein